MVLKNGETGQFTSATDKAHGGDRARGRHADGDEVKDESLVVCR